jgi:copper chaperone CopZ
MATIIFRIGNIHCIGCVNRIISALTLKGATNVDIDFSTHIAKVVTDENNPEIDTYLQAILRTGYKAEYILTLKEE